MVKAKKKKKSFIGLFLRFCTFLLLITLLLSFAARYISPERIWILAFFGILFPYLYILNIIIFIFWLIFRKRMALYAFIVLLICTVPFFCFFNIFSVTKKAGNDKNNASLNLMSFNVRDFNLGNPNKDKDKKLRRNSIFDFIKDQSPDIVCFQEAYFDTLHRYKTIDTLIQLQDAKNSHIFFSFKRHEHRFGIATLSKYPIIDRQIITFKESMKNLCIYTDILFNEDTVRIYNAHFSSIGLSPEDLIFIENISTLSFDDGAPKEADHGIKKIARRLKNAFIERANQVATVSEHIKACHYPSVLCTDLNDTPSSYAYHLLTKYLSDAFLKSGVGIGKTYNGILPYFRIDYIFYSKDFDSYNFRTHLRDLSDHYPISVSLYLNK